MKDEITLLKQLTRFNPIAERSHRTVVARRVLTLSVLAFTSLASMPVRAQDSSPVAESQDQVSRFTDYGLEGVWDVTVTIRDSAGNPLQSFRAMNMYIRGGVFGVPTASGQKTTLSQCGIGPSERAKAFGIPRWAGCHNRWREGRARRLPIIGSGFASFRGARSTHYQKFIVG